MHDTPAVGGVTNSELELAVVAASRRAEALRLELALERAKQLVPLAAEAIAILDRERLALAEQEGDVVAEPAHRDNEGPDDVAEAEKTLLELKHALEQLVGWPFVFRRRHRATLTGLGQR